MPLVKYGGVLMKMRSSRVRPSVARHVTGVGSRSRAASGSTPLGRPVVPDVNMIIASSSARTGADTEGVGRSDRLRRSGSRPARAPAAGRPRSPSSPA